MERYNPFSNASLADEVDPFSVNPNRPAATESGQSPRRYIQSDSRTDSTGSDRYTATGPSRATPQTSSLASRYSTTFPDPFGPAEPEPPAPLPSNDASNDANPPPLASAQVSSNKPNSVTFAPSSRSVDDPVAVASPSRPSRRETGGGISSFLSRATSVTSSTVTDRVNEAVGSVRSAVDSISSQIQQAVPTNLNERLSASADTVNRSSNEQQQQQQISAASYLASKISSATNQFTSSSPSSGTLPTISRQRVILVLDSVADIEWSQQFINYRRLASGLGPASNNPLTSFFSSATAQLTSSLTSTSAGQTLEGVDLVEQAEFSDVSVLANQSSSTVLVTSKSQQVAGGGSGGRRELARLIRPEYVVIRQRTKNGLDHMRGVVTALNYCLVPMFEPIEIWNTFQDRQLVFSRLLRIQKLLGRESFPLIPQVYCQTHQDLLNYINSSSVIMPCLLRTGQSGRGKIRLDNIQMLRDFASIVATSNLSCTVEPYLDVKCDLVVQKIGTSLKLFRKSANVQTNATDQATDDTGRLVSADSRQIDSQAPSQFGGAKQSASRQTSLGTGVLSSFISSQTQQQVSRRSSVPSSQAYEKLAEVNVRYRGWMESISREFDNKLHAFQVKLIVTNQDREYIVGLGNCSMDFLGNVDNQEEDRNSFVELIVNNMNAVLPRAVAGGGGGKEASSNNPLQGAGGRDLSARRSSSEDKTGAVHRTSSSSFGYSSATSGAGATQDSPLSEKKRFASQSQINGVSGGQQATSRQHGQHSGAGGGQMGNRSQSVSMNQSEYMMMDRDAMNNKSSSAVARRGSDRSDSLTSVSASSQHLPTTGSSADSGAASGVLHQRQGSLGQSFFDQTSTAFNTLQKQSMSFFKRLDSRAGDMGSSTPPQSAKSDQTGFDERSAFKTASSNDDILGGRAKNGFKSQSVDSSALDSNKPRRRETPPKPPPPQCLGNRQHSLASYSSQSMRQPVASQTPASTRQNSANISSESSSVQRARVVRQNSALSAFEPYDPDITIHQHDDPPPTAKIGASSSTNTTQMSRTQQPTGGDGGSRMIAHKQLEPVKKSSNFDSASITSGDSNSTSETTTAEDTMNNLKKTFASIFGDKVDPE